MSIESLSDGKLWIHISNDGIIWDYILNMGFYSGAIWFDDFGWAYRKNYKELRWKTQ